MSEKLFRLFLRPEKRAARGITEIPAIQDRERSGRPWISPKHRMFNKTPPICGLRGFFLSNSLLFSELLIFPLLQYSINASHSDAQLTSNSLLDDSGIFLLKFLGLEGFFWAVEFRPLWRAVGFHTLFNRSSKLKGMTWVILASFSKSG